MSERRQSTWALVPAVYAVVRLVQLLTHWLLPTPYGVRLASVSPEQLPRAALLSATSILVLLVLFRLLAHGAARLAGPAGSQGVLFAYTAFLAFLLVYGQADLELMRWLGQHVDLGWFRAYGWKPDALKTRLFHADLVPSSIAFALAFLSPLVLVTVAIRGRASTSLRWLTTGVLAIPMLLCLDFSLPILANRAELSPVQPAIVTLGDEALRRLGRRPTEEELARGVAMLHEVVGRAASEFPVTGYPLWRVVPDEETRLARFRALPAAEKRDLVLVLFESPQGWEFDLTRPEARREFPALASLLAERGVFFPHAQSVGFPSPEGRVGVHLGIWSHPTDRIIEGSFGIRTLALPQILARAGYQTALVAAGDPHFDQMERWYDRWYQSWEYDEKRSDDRSAADRVLEVLADRSAGKPRFVLFNTVQTHQPLTFPGSVDDPSQPFHARYMAAARFSDAALGRLFDGLRASGRWDRTVVIVVGDHSWPGPWIGLQAPRAGTPNAGETWIPLLIAAPELRGGEIRDHTVSQLDVPPTALRLLGVAASSHFVGHNLLGRAHAASEGALSFRNGGIAFTFGGVRLQLDGRPGGFLKKTRTYDWDPGCADPEPYGCYRNGTPLPIAPEDPARLEKLRVAARAYAELVDADRLMPPDGALPYRSRP